MTINHEFFINRIYTMPQVGDLQNVIAKVEWRVLLTRNGAKSVGGGETMLDLTALNGANFVPITELTADTVIGWVIEKEGGEAFIQHLKDIHESDLAKKEQELQLTPWNVPLVNPKRWDDAYAR
jgi:hypothetical protein